MVTQIGKILHKRYPQNFIVRKPILGTILYSLFIFLFLVMYKPLGVRAARDFNLIVTMFFYQSLSSVLVLILAMVLKWTNCFSKNKTWTFGKELISMVIILVGAGIAIYFIGFLVEAPANRWNIPTFLDSVFRGILIGIIPVLFFTLSNLRHLYVTDVVQEFKSDFDSPSYEPKEDLIHMNSQLKKEELKFYPSELIYAESEGNYVVFYLNNSDKPVKIMIRNSITNIERQLSDVPFLVRTHRAFIVNVKKVSSKKGNSLGYRLKFDGINEEVPVSRQNTQKFDELISQFR